MCMQLLFISVDLHSMFISLKMHTFANWLGKKENWKSPLIYITNLLVKPNWILIFLVKGLGARMKTSTNDHRSCKTCSQIFRSRGRERGKFWYKTLVTWNFSDHFYKNQLFKKSWTAILKIWKFLSRPLLNVDAISNCDLNVMHWMWCTRNYLWNSGVMLINKNTMNLHQQV